jgi:hypothetical protein
MRTHTCLLCLSLHLSLLGAGLPAQAQVYRCSGPSGEPLFTQQPCGEAVPLDGAAAPVAAGAPASGLRPGELSWLKARERDRGKAAHRPKRRGAAREGVDERQAYQCQRKRRLLDAVKAKLRRGYKPTQGEGLRRRRQGYEDYIAAFCS